MVSFCSFSSPSSVVSESNSSHATGLTLLEPVDAFLPSGSGAVYSFDPVGSYEREFCRAAGAAQSLIQPFLDNQVRPFPSFVSLLLRASSLSQTHLQFFIPRPRAQIYFKNQTYPSAELTPTPGQLPLSTVLSLVADTFTSATERHIEVGDGLEIFIVMSLPVGGWEEGLKNVGQGAEVLESLGTVGGCETRLLIVRRELKKD